MTRRRTVLNRAMTAALVAAVGLAAGMSRAEARVHHRRHAVAVAPQQDAARAAPPRQQGVVGYFGPGAYGPLGLLGPGYGYGYGYGWYGQPRGDLGFALLGALNGGGLRGFVECGNYYARYPGACGF